MSKSPLISKTGMLRSLVDYFCLNSFFLRLCPRINLYLKSTLVEIIFLEGRRKVKEKKEFGTQMAAPLSRI